MTVQFDTDPITREEWLLWRRQGVGASEVAPIIGVSPWSDAVEVWADKISTEPPVELDTEPIHFGHVMEPIVLAEYERRNDEIVQLRGARVTDPDHPWRRCTLDGATTERVVEAKNNQDWPWDEPPMYYVAQVTWQMGLTGLHDGVLAVIHRGNTYMEYPVEWNPELFDALVAKVDAFWLMVLEHRHPRDAVEASEKVIELASRLHQASAQRLALEKEEKQLKADLLLCLDGSPEAHVNGHTVVTAVPQDRKKLDSDAIVTALAMARRITPDEITSAYTVQTTTSPVVRVNTKTLATLQGES